MQPGRFPMLELRVSSHERWSSSTPPRSAALVATPTTRGTLLWAALLLAEFDGGPGEGEAALKRFLEGLPAAPSRCSGPTIEKPERLSGPSGGGRASW